MTQEEADPYQISEGAPKSKTIFNNRYEAGLMSDII